MYQKSKKRKGYRSTEEYKLKWKEYQNTDEYKNKLKKYRNSSTYQVDRKNSDPLYKMTCMIRTNISNSIKNGGYSKSSKTFEILGCSFESFKVHIENQFKEGMSWKNYGEWEYDHITQLSKANSEKEIIELNHYTNFQPLWKRENRQKNTKKTAKKI